MQSTTQKRNWIDQIFPFLEKCYAQIYALIVNVGQLLFQILHVHKWRHLERRISANGISVLKFYVCTNPSCSKFQIRVIGGDITLIEGDDYWKDSTSGYHLVLRWCKDINNLAVDLSKPKQQY